MLKQIPTSLLNNESLFTTADKLHLTPDRLAEAVSALGQHTTRQWRGKELPPRETLPDGYTRSRKHKYSLERSALSIIASAQTGAITDEIYDATASKIKPQPATREFIHGILSYWAYRTRTYGVSRPDLPTAEVGTLRTIRIAEALTRRTLQTAAEELCAVLGSPTTNTPTLSTLKPSLAYRLKESEQQRRSISAQLRRDPASVLPTTFAELTNHHIAAIVESLPDDDQLEISSASVGADRTALTGVPSICPDSTT